MNNGNEPAFPCSDAIIKLGLTKREYLAGLAMQAIVSSIDSEENYQRLKGHASARGLKVSQWIANDAVKQADAILAALTDKEKGE